METPQAANSSSNRPYRIHEVGAAGRGDDDYVHALPVGESMEPICEGETVGGIELLDDETRIDCPECLESLAVDPSSSVRASELLGDIADQVRQIDRAVGNAISDRIRGSLSAEIPRASWGQVFCLRSTPEIGFDRGDTDAGAENKMAIVATCYSEVMFYPDALGLSGRLSVRLSGQYPETWSDFWQRVCVCWAMDHPEDGWDLQSQIPHVIDSSPETALTILTAATAMSERR